MGGQGGGGDQKTYIKKFHYLDCLFTSQVKKCGLTLKKNEPHQSIHVTSSLIIMVIDLSEICVE